MSQPIQSCFERYEKKYFLTPAGQKALLQAIAPYIRMDFYGKYTICNLYYDTPDWRLIRASLAKPVYKEKLRVRSYGVPAPDGMVFAELKKKYAGVVYKRRITVPAAEVQPLLAGQRPLAAYGQIGREIAWFQQLYDARPGCSSGTTASPLLAWPTRSCASPLIPASAGVPHSWSFAPEITALPCCRTTGCCWSSNYRASARCGWPMHWPRPELCRFPFPNTAAATAIICCASSLYP